ncbi:alpha-1B-glycoprotein-like isoform X1, partial [Tachysurus ichikawai]
THTPPIPPHLSVLPPDGRVRPGQVVEFHCQALPTVTPVAFVLQKQQREEEDVQIVSHSTYPHFRVGPVGVADSGIYTCFYQLIKPEGVQNSAPSSPVSVNIGVEVPAPHLSQGSEGALVCTGSPSYPGAHFSLFQQGSSSPLATKTAHMIQHSMQFAASGQLEDGGRYQCQYSVLLGNNWAHSDLSSPIRLACVTGTHTPPIPPHLSVLPPDGRVRPGQVVEFHCQALPTVTPVAFVLQKQQREEEDVQIVSHSTYPHFRVGPVGVADSGIYTCFYQLIKPEGVQNSAPSSPVSVNIGVEVPAPHLSQGSEGALVCTGSPSYPGAHFSLFQQGSSSPLATKTAHMIQHSMQFAASGQLEDGGRYQCQYSVLLGNNWAHSDLSSPIRLACVT